MCHLPFGPTAYFTLSNVVMRHDIPEVGTMSEQFPHLIFHNFSSRLGNRVTLVVFIFYSCTLPVLTRQRDLRIVRVYLSVILCIHEASSSSGKHFHIDKLQFKFEFGSCLTHFKLLSLDSEIVYFLCFLNISYVCSALR